MTKHESEVAGDARIKNLLKKFRFTLNAASLFFIVSLSGCSVKKVASFTAESILFAIGLLAVPIMVYFLIRIFLIMQITRFMRKRSGSDAFHQDETAESKDLVTPDLKFQSYAETDDIPLQPAQRVQFEQAINTGEQTWWVFKKSVKVLFLSVAGVVVLTLILRVEFNLYPSFILLFSFFTIMFFTWRKFKSLRRVKLRRALLNYVLAGVLVGFFMMFEADKRNMLYILPVVVSIVYLLVGYQKIRRGIMKGENKKLMILRVFGADLNTAFLFREVSRVWRFMGTFITVADPSLVRYQYSLSSRENRSVIIRLYIFYFSFIALVVGTVAVDTAFLRDIRYILFWDQVPWMEQCVFVSMALWILFFPIIVFFLIRFVKRRFVSDEKSLTKFMDRVNKTVVGWSSAYKNVTLFCYDNIWKRAVRSSLDMSKAVLMDLRGYTPERKGCEFEIGLLLNHYPVNRVILLLDKGEHEEFIKQLISKLWKTMHPDSPNRKLRDAVLRIYFPGDEDKTDIIRIVALIISGFDMVQTQEQPAGQTVPESSEAINKPPGYLGDSKSTPKGSLMPVLDFNKENNIYLLKGESTSAPRGSSKHSFIERFDLLLTHPDKARIFIPALLLMLALLVVIRIRPAMKYFDLANYVQLVEPQKLLADQVSSNIDVLVNGEIYSNASKMEDQYGTNGQGTSYSSCVRLNLNLVGGILDSAIQYESVILDSILTDSGQPVQWFDLVDARDQALTESAKGPVLYTDSITGVPKMESSHGTVYLNIRHEYIQGMQAVSLVKGRMNLTMGDKNDRWVVENIDSILLKSGIINIRIPQFDSLWSLYLIRSTTDKDMVKVFGENMNESISWTMRTATTWICEETITKSPAYTKWTFAFSDLSDSYMEIFPVANEKREWIFEAKNIPIQ